ncbi:MAG TPA: hypothetical protein VGQ69_01350 [Gemmatimonadales bacterium]|jgi:hypothetical protein|nr:hypothetical protein [Gemmatimonadales bacterium]
MRRIGLLTLFAGLMSTGVAAAQSSQFGARGLGLPLRPFSVRASATGGAFGLFDAESALNPASIGLLARLNASFQTVQSWRHSENPAGSASARDNRYPGVFVAGPLGGTRFALALSASGYTDRNFSLVSQDTVVLRGVPVGVTDTLGSQGGISDLRLAIAWRQSQKVQWGLGIHLLTGSNRITSHRVFSDTAYAGVSENNTVSYLGFGASAGIVARVGRMVTLAGMLRAEDHMHVQRDTSRFGDTKLPLTASGGIRVLLGERVQLSGSALFRNWSVADADLVAQGGVGSVNTTEFSGGVEILTNARRPSQLPIRMGAFHARLPFPLQRGENVSETGISLGSGLRFGGDRAGLEAALARVWRKGAPGFSEHATLLTLGISLRP